MKSHLFAVFVLVLNRHFTTCEKCEIPIDKYANCIISESYNVKSFQGEFFSFKSDCSYTAAEFKKDGEQVRVDIAKDVIRLLVDGKRYELKLSANKEIKFTTEGTTYSLPAKEGDVEVIKPGTFAVAKFPTADLRVKWDGMQSIVIEVDNANNYSISGICSKSCDESVSSFTEQWKTSKACSSEEIKSCDFAKKASALQFCRKLLSTNKYGRCRQMSNVKSFLDQCQLTYCNCRKPHNDCMCSLMDAFVKHCEAKTGQTVAWREKNFCEKKCRNPHQRYMECGRRQRACGEPMTKNGEESCVEGCSCPLNLWLTENKCVTEEECPCRYENIDYKPGSSVVQDCKTCVCVNNNKWNCPPTICYGEADVIGDPHYTTFDGKRYDFMGKCTYYLVRGVDFDITADHYVLENGQFVKNYKSSAPSWTKVVQIMYGGNVVTLKPNLVVTFNDKEIKKFPFKAGNITISKPISSKVIVELPNYAEVHWDGSSAAKIRLPTTMRGYIQGLMGNFNKNPKDDFMLPDGTVVDDPNTFGHSWKVDGSCEDENTDPIPHPCEDMPSHKPVAERACSVLKGDLFKDCKEYNAQESYESCVYDCCHAVKLGEKCACETIAGHAARCLKVKAQWRKQVSACEIECPTGQVYNYCLNPCESSCDYISLNPKCQKQCLEGCGCPNGQTFDENKKCVPIEKCKCRIKGKYFPVGYKFVANDKLKTCAKGKWEESPASKDDKKKYGTDEDIKKKCTKKPNSEYTACKIPAPITCKNMDTFKEETSDTCSEQEGCECLEGYVLNPANDSCVKKEDCPCFFYGKSYDNLTERKTMTGKCICKSNVWDCIKDKNAIEKCSVFGDLHVRNLDGKLISFKSTCEYILAKGEFNNKPYMITIKGDDIIVTYMDNSNKKIKTTLNKDSPAFPKIEDVVDFEATKMLEIEDIGLKLIWNKDGIFHLQFSSQDADKVEGLCAKLDDPDSVNNKNDLRYLIDTWNNDLTCFDLDIPKNKDLYDIDGKPIPTKCDVLKSDKFKTCTNKLPVDDYYNSCILTAQNNLLGDDPKSLEKFYCQIFSAFAKECTDIGNPLQWRSTDLCPIECPQEKVYNQCVSPCTCDIIEKSGECSDRSCIEGCVTIGCPQGKIYTNNSYAECTTAKDCAQIKCLKDLKDESCQCENGEVVCTTTTETSTTITTTNTPVTVPIITTTEEIPVIEPEARTDAQTELIDAFYDVKTSLENINDPSIYEKLSPKDKDMIETFTNHVEEFEDEVTCYANLVDRSKCKCFNGEQICGLKKNENNQVEIDHDVQNNLELIKFMQSHLRCLENLKENPDNCSCISGKRICPEKRVIASTTPKSAPVLYYYITKCERGVVISFYNLHFAKEGLNCLTQLNKDPLKNCRCEKGQMICTLQPKPQTPSRKPKEITKDVYIDYINDVKKQLQCQVKIANRQESCRCEKGLEVCTKIPEPIPEDNNYEIVKKYSDSPVNKTQLYDTFEKGLECTEELGEETKVCTCTNGEKECFDMDFETPVEGPPADEPDPIKNTLTKVEEAKSQIVCLMRRDVTPRCSKYELGHINSSTDDILQYNVYLQYLRQINEQSSCLRDKPSYCLCVMGKQQCSFDQPAVPNQKQKENDQIMLYNTFLDHIDMQMKCLRQLKGKGKNCYCDNGQEKCETDKNYIIYPLLDNSVLGEYDKEILFPHIEKQLHCFDGIKTVSNKCSCKDGVAECAKPEVPPEPEPDDNFSKMKQHIPAQLKTIDKVDNKIQCFISGGKRRNCYKIMPDQNVYAQLQEVITTPDKQLLNVYDNYLDHIKEQLTCFSGIPSINCICSNGQFICGPNFTPNELYRNNAANTMNLYGRFIVYVDSQLNCLESLINGDKNLFCACGINKMCGMEPKPSKLVQLIDTSTPMYKDPDKLYPHIDSQLNCLFEIQDTDGECYCSNGVKICNSKQPQRVCPPANCSPDMQIRECEECCPKCETKHCVVNSIFGDTTTQVIKKIGEIWREPNCRECQCLVDHLGPHTYCKQQQCPTIPNNQRGEYVYVSTPGECCPQIVQAGCKHNGNIYPVNSVIYKSECETMLCVVNNFGEITKQIRKITCNTTCPPGFAYTPISSQCCGECTPMGCLFNNEVKQHGDVWYTNDKCFKFRCMKQNDQWVVSKIGRNCRPIGFCNGVIKMYDCCPYCDRSFGYY